ncbi:MAG: FAD-dependent oxidoreductase [Hyphomicrobiaceae bacterium]
MPVPLPSNARVVVVGGGIIGCSVAYHLAKLGWSDIVVLERAQLTAGTTWHAAGLVMQLRTSFVLTELCRYGVGFLHHIERESGQSTGFKQVGTLAVARTQERMIELRRLASLAKCFQVDAGMVTPAEAAGRHPMIDPKRIEGALYIAGDGQTNPIDTTMAVAKAARQLGVQFHECTRVTAIKQKNGRATGVSTGRGDIGCEVIVNACGIWAPRIGKMAGVSIPLHACEHMYVTTGAMEGARGNLPVIRDTDGCFYVKEDAGKLLVGAFEPVGKPISLDDLPEQFEFGELQEDWDHFQLPMSNAIELIPALANAEIRHFLNGPESFTPDNKFLLGEAPELQNFYVAAGFNSQGILSAAGAGKALAEWIVAGHATMDLSEVDISRMQSFQGNTRYLRERVRESLGLLYAMHWPHRQVESARPVRRSSLHRELAELNACFGEAAGWERANWYAPSGVAPSYAYSYGRQNWFPYAAEEHRAVRERVGIFDLSSFGKFLIQGRDAERELQRICANDVAVANGKIVYTGVLNHRGGYEADLTITRLAADRFLLVTAAASQRRDFSWLTRHLDPEACASITDMTSAYAVLSVMGPQSRALLQNLTNSSLADADFPFGTAREIEIGYAKAHALRITYVGELGWELYVATEFSAPLFGQLLAAGKRFGLAPCGYHALDTLRAEKGYRHWGHDISPADTPLEAGLGFAVAWDKTADFIGRKALMRQKEAGIGRRQVLLKVADPEQILLHDEPIWRDGEIVGRVTSGAYGHTLGSSVGLGYVACSGSLRQPDLDASVFEVEIACHRFRAAVSLRPFYDPANLRVRGQ